jgi:hypothetical protein
MSCTPTPRRLFAIQPDGGGREPGGTNMKKLHCISAFLALTTAGVLSAQTSDTTAPRGPHRGGHRGPGGPGHPIVRALDVDKNGEISAEEIAAAPATLAKLDANSDGVVAADELRPARPADAPTPPAGAKTRMATRAHPDDLMMLALDANKDGALSPTEIAGAVASLKALDANSDGKLTRDELRPLPPANN